jgi:hypothetical protein
VKRFTASLVAKPALDVLRDGNASGVVRGAGDAATYIDAAGFVIAITGRDVPAMPNGISVSQRGGLRVFESGSKVEFGREGVSGADAVVSFGGRRIWNPRIRQWRNPEGLRAIGKGIWRRLLLAGADDPTRMVDSLTRAGYETASGDYGRDGLEALFRSLGDRDVEFIRRAEQLLIGRGPGLTPEGDDFLAAVAATVYACEPAMAWSEGLDAWRSAVLPAGLRDRTTALSATLLELAVQGFVSEPAQTLFEREASSDVWLDALRRLEKVGHGTGRAWAAGCAAAAILLMR